MGAQKGLCSQGPSSFPTSRGTEGPPAPSPHLPVVQWAPVLSVSRLVHTGFPGRASCSEHSALLWRSLCVPARVLGRKWNQCTLGLQGGWANPLGEEGVPPPQALSPPPAGGAPLSDAAARAHPPGGGDPAAGPGGGHRRGPQPHRHHHQHPQRGGQRFPGGWAPSSQTRACVELRLRPPPQQQDLGLGPAWQRALCEVLPGL